MVVAGYVGLFTNLQCDNMWLGWVDFINLSVWELGGVLSLV